MRFLRLGILFITATRDPRDLPLSFSRPNPLAQIASASQLHLSLFASSPCAFIRLSFIPSPLRVLLFLLCPSFTPFTPSAEYRSSSRNVVLAFARVPFYPSARRLIRVFSPHLSKCPFSLFSYVSPPFSLSLILARTFVYLPCPRVSFVSSCSSDQLRFRTLLSEKFKYGISAVVRATERARADLWKMKMA